MEEEGKGTVRGKEGWREGRGEEEEQPNAYCL